MSDKKTPKSILRYTFYVQYLEITYFTGKSKIYYNYFGKMLRGFL